ncbi:MAG: hypothetical protein KF896_13055 [Ignavibacteriae bacterium]|nr:hypothetical protein [Ignavibacteriota bacterium]
MALIIEPSPNMSVSRNPVDYDYKPFGDTLWTSAGTMNRDNFDGSTNKIEN